MDETLRSKVINILNEEQQQLQGCLDVPENVDIPSTTQTLVTQQNPDGTTTQKIVETENNFINPSINGELRQSIIDKATDLRDFCKIIDDKIISFNAQINSKKQEIVTLSTTATNANCWPGIACSTLLVGGTTCSGTYQFNYGTYTSINNDIENLRIYPNMAGPTVRYDVANVFEPDAIYPLTSDYSGYGYKNLQDPIFYKNNDGTLAGSLSDGSGSNIGIGRFDISATSGDHTAKIIAPKIYYTGATISGETCAGIANSITAIYNEILQLRIQRDSLRSDLNVIKDNKKEKELAAWGMNRMYRQIDARSTKNSSAISAVKAFDSNDLLVPTALVLHLDVSEPTSYKVGIGTTTWYDLSGQGNHATLLPTNSPATYEYSNNGFLTFNGSDDYAQTKVKASNILGAGTTWTTEIWFKINGDSSTTFNTVVSAAGTIAALSGIITGITTTSIAVGQYINPITNVIGSGTTVTAIGIGTVYINPIGIGTSTREKQTFSFGTYPLYTNALVDFNSSASTANLLSVSNGQSGIFAGVSTGRIVYTTLQSGTSTHLVGAAVTAGLWYHAAVVRNGTDKTTLYLNGVGVATYSGNFPNSTSSTTSVKIARFDDETIYSNASIAIVKAYQKSYTDDEIKEKFNAFRNRYTPLG